MDSLKCIKNKLSSTDIDVIVLCQKFIEERSYQEQLRGESAERRANIILSTLGASSAFLVFIASNIISDSSNKPLHWEVILLFSASILWIFRSIWYCLKSIQAQSRFKITGESIFEIQDKNYINALKELLSGRVWELQHTIPKNSERLFYVQRAQRALIVFICILLFLGIFEVIQQYFKIHISTCILFIFSILGIAFWFLGDDFFEKRGIWQK